MVSGANESSRLASLAETAGPERDASEATVTPGDSSEPGADSGLRSSLHDVFVKRSFDVAAAGRLAHEARALRRCGDIKGVVELVGYDAGSNELATRRAPGRPLSPEVWRVASPDERRALARELIEVVEAVHARGVVHRDLKPEHIIVSPECEVTLIDFDHALIDGEGPPGGTQAYAAPEAYMLPWPGLVDYRADHFALALLLRGLLFDLPHRVDDATRWHLVSNPAPLPERDDPLLAAIERHLAPWRADRPDTLDEVRAYLSDGEDDGGRARSVLVSTTQAARVEGLPEDLYPEVARDLDSLVPKVAPGAPVFATRLPTSELSALLGRLGRRRTLVAGSRREDRFEIAHLGLAAGLWRETLASCRRQGGPEDALIEAIAANALGAHREAKRRLQSLKHGLGTSVHDATICAVLAESLAGRGRFDEMREPIRRAFSLARPEGFEERTRFWTAIAASHLAAMGIAELARLLESVPRGELFVASVVVLELAAEKAEQLLALDAHLRMRHPGHSRLFELVTRGRIVDLLHLIAELAELHRPFDRDGTRHLEVLGERAATVLAELDAWSRGPDPDALERALGEQECVFEGLPDAEADAHREMLTDLIDAMARLGWPARDLRWRRARLHALRKDHAGVIAAAVEAHREGGRDWRMWLMAVPSYLSLGRRADARMALSLLKELAPEEVVEGVTVRELEAAVGGAGIA